MDNTAYGLTIIIPHYNTPDFLVHMLQSIGLHDGVQIIVVDDHSDQYLEELAECRNSFHYVQFFHTGYGSKGAGAARNVGLRHAKGRWLMFADADDEFLPGWFEAVSNYLESDNDLICFAPTGRKQDHSSSDRHLRLAAIAENYLVGGYGAEERLRYRFSVPWSKLIRADVVFNNDIRFDEVPYSNDVMFSAKVGFYAGKITADRHPVYCVVEHEGSLTYDNSGEIYCQRMKIICEREKFLEQHLSRKQMKACGRISTVSSMKDAIQRGYGTETLMELYRLFQQYRIPFVVINLKRRLAKAGGRLRKRPRQ